MLHGVGVAFLALISGVQLAAAFVSDTCGAPMTNEQSQRIVAYVREKYNVLERAGLHIAEKTAVRDTCYRRVVLTGKAAATAYAFTFYVSPDGRMLSTDLFDVMRVPVEEAQQREKEVAAKLARNATTLWGNESAAVTVVVFLDFQCPFCKSTWDVIKKEVSSMGEQNSRLVVRHFPLPQHSWAQVAAEVAVCAAKQRSDAGWKISDFLFDKQGSLSEQSIRRSVLEAVQAVDGVNVNEFQQCLDSRIGAGAVIEDVALGRLMAVEGTPTVFINGRRVVVGNSAERLREALKVAAEEQNRGTAGTTKQRGGDV